MQPFELASALVTTIAYEENRRQRRVQLLLNTDRSPATSLDFIRRQRLREKVEMVLVGCALDEDVPSIYMQPLQDMLDQFFENEYGPKIPVPMIRLKLEMRERLFRALGEYPPSIPIREDEA